MMVPPGSMKLLHCEIKHLHKIQCIIFAFKHQIFTPSKDAACAFLNPWGETLQLSNQIPVVPFKEPADLECIMNLPVTDRKDE